MESIIGEDCKIEIPGSYINHGEIMSNIKDQGTITFVMSFQPTLKCHKCGNIDGFYEHQGESANNKDTKIRLVTCGFCGVVIKGKIFNGNKQVDIMPA